MSLLRSALPLLLAVGLTVGLCACADTEELLAKGHIADACRRAIDRPEELPVFDAWVTQNARVDAKAVPAAEVEAGLGNVVRGYGTEVVLYDVVASVPGGKAEIEAVTTRPIEELILRLPELVQLSRPPRAASINEFDLQPTPRATYRRSQRDPITDFIDAIGAVGMGIGVALGAAVAVPVGLMVGAVEGFASFLDALFGGGSGPDVAERLAPIRYEDPVDQTRADALLWLSETEAAYHAIQQMYQRHVDAVNAERARRVALANDPNLLGADPGACKVSGKCRVLVDKLPRTMKTSLHFGERCFWEVNARVFAEPFEMTLGEPKNELDFERAKIARLTHPIDATVPEFARIHAGALPKGAVKVSKAESTVEALTDLACSVRVKSARWDVDGSAPDLVARIQAGKIMTRAHTVFLGKNVSDATFITHEIHLQRGERVKLSLVSREDRSLGGAVLDFDGRVPIVLENSAFKATCNAPEIDGKAKARAMQDMLTAIANYESHEAIDSHASLTRLAKKREAARAALVKYAAFVGFAKAPTL